MDQAESALSPPDVKRTYPGHIGVEIILVSAVRGGEPLLHCGRFVSDHLRGGLPAFPSANSTRRRIATDRGGASSCLAAQASIDARRAGESRMAVTGSCPVAGLPLFLFCNTVIDSTIYS